MPLTENAAQLTVLQRLAEAADEELELQHVPHLSMQAARAAFERAHSRDPAPVSAEDLDRFVADAHKALDAVTNADWTLARKLLQSALEHGTRAIESTNRNQRTSKQLFQACLLTVQVMAEAGDQTAARAQALECTVRSPGMELPPNSSEYAPVVRELLAEAQQFLSQERTGPLVIESKPSGCAVHVNGRRLGVTPFSLMNPARRPYLVQVECEGERPGRVHLVTPSDAPTKVWVDASFENAIQTDDAGLRLAYPELPHPLAREHVRALLEAVHAKQALVLTDPQGGRLALQRVGPAGASTVFLEETYTREQLHQAISELFDSALPDDEVASTSHHAPQSAHLGRWQKALIIGGLVAGGAAWGVGDARYVLKTRAGDAYQRTVPGSGAVVERATAWDGKRAAPYVWASVGSALLTAGALGPLLAARRTPPWWAAAVIGAVGTGLVAWGTVDLLAGGHCGTGGAPIQTSCVDSQDRRDRGGLLLLTSIPLVSILAVKIGRAMWGTSAERREVVVLPRADRRSAGVDLGLRL